MKLISQAGVSDPPVGEWRHRALFAAALFCVSTFAISSFRTSLNPQIAFTLFDPKRVALLIAGACVFWLAISAAHRQRPDLRALGRIAMIAVPGMALLFAMAVGWDVLVAQRPENLVARNLRWILLWSGYFGTGLAAWLAVQYGAALAQVEADAAHPARLRPDTLQSTAGAAADRGFWVKTGRQTIHIAHAAVEWIEAEGNYVRVHGTDGAHGLVRMTLAGTAAELDSADFVRIHRSALCRRSAIKGYRRKASGAMLVLLASGTEAPLGRSFAKDLVNQMRSLAGASNAELDVVTDDTVTRPSAETLPG